MENGRESVVEDGVACAILVAGGKGTRSGAHENKVLTEVAGVPVLIRSLRSFLTTGLFSTIVVVFAGGEESVVRTLLDKWLPNERIILCSGGATRQASVLAGLETVQKEGFPGMTPVLVHDAARPFVSPGTVRDCFDAVVHYGAACVGVPVKDTIKVVKEQVIKQTLDRSLLWQVQTPQGFRLYLLAEAHAAAKTEGITGTDDAMLVEQMGIPVHMVMGQYENIKMTTPEDWRIAEALLANEATS